MYLMPLPGGKGSKGKAAQTGSDDGNFHGKHPFAAE
jgi:hypothetical protein